MFPSDYNDQKVVECINSELVNTLGNLLSRCSGTAVNPSQEVPAVDWGMFRSRASQAEKDMVHSLQTLPRE